MVEECDESFLKFDLDYDQVSGTQIEAQLPLFLSSDLIVNFHHFCLMMLIMIWLAARCPGDKNCKGCDSGHSDNTLYTFGYVRRPEELRCWLVQPDDPTILSGNATASHR